jgi:hypothetical protein
MKKKAHMWSFWSLQIHHFYSKMPFLACKICILFFTEIYFNHKIALKDEASCKPKAGISAIESTLWQTDGIVKQIIKGSIPWGESTVVVTNMKNSRNFKQDLKNIYVTSTVFFQFYYEIRYFVLLFFTPFGKFLVFIY